MEKLSDSELDVMLAIWGAGKPVPAPYIRDQISGKRDWPLPTVYTVLKRMEAKGYLAVEKAGQMNLYRPLVSAQAYRAKESKSVLGKLFGNRVRGLVSALYEDHPISKDELDDLRSLLDELEEKEGS